MTELNFADVGAEPDGFESFEHGTNGIQVFHEGAVTAHINIVDVMTGNRTGQVRITLGLEATKMQIPNGLTDRFMEMGGKRGEAKGSTHELEMPFLGMQAGYRKSGQGSALRRDPELVEPLHEVGSGCEPEVVRVRDSSFYFLFSGFEGMATTRGDLMKAKLKSRRIRHVDR